MVNDPSKDLTTHSIGKFQLDFFKAFPKEIVTYSNVYVSYVLTIGPVPWFCGKRGGGLVHMDIQINVQKREICRSVRVARYKSS